MTYRTLCVVSLLSLIVCSLPAQETAVHPPVATIPRRIYVGSVEGLDQYPDANEKKLLRSLPSLLFSEISTLQPCVLVASASEAHSLLSFALVSDESFLELVVRLSEVREQVPTEREVEVHRYTLPNDRLDISSLRDFITTTARALAPTLTEVPQKVTREQIQQEESRKEIEEAVGFEREMESGYELYLAGFAPRLTLSRLATIDNSPMGLILHDISAFPVSADLFFYNRSNLAFVTSFFVDSNSFMSFYSRDTVIDTNPDTGLVLNVDKSDTVASNNFMLLPGLGIGSRTPGRLSASFAVLLYVGALKIEVLEPVYHYWRSSFEGFDNLVELAAGEVRWHLFSYLNIRQSLQYNITTSLFVAASLDLYFNPIQLITQDTWGMPYSWIDSVMFFRLPALVIGVRL